MKRILTTIALAINVFAVNAQSFTLRGTVLNESKEPIVGVNVIIKESEKISTVTDNKGKFEISLPDTMKYANIVFLVTGYMTPEYYIDRKKHDIKVIMIRGTATSVRPTNTTTAATGIKTSAKTVVTEASYEIDEDVFVSDVAVTAERPVIEMDMAESVSRISSEDVYHVAMESISTAKKYSDKTKPSVENNIKAGKLTSGEVNDFAKWHLWGDILKNDFKQYADTWGFKPLNRYIAQLTNKQGMPIQNAEVTLKNNKGELLWKSKTDNTGKAELWIDFFKSEQNSNTHSLKLVFKYEGKTAEISNVIPFEQGINTAQINVECSKRNKVDMFFMVDATGSMSDEIRYLQVELDDIIQKIHQQQSELQLRTGSLVYRDHGDQYLTRKSFLSDDVNKTLDFLRKQSAGGGGDYPEAVDVALFESITNEDWDDEALARILFIVLDAPSHSSPEVIARLESQLRLAAEKGIRIVPIACSDIQKDGEYLMRAFALATNGTYLFLTDDSGVGNAHIKPTTDKYEVEKLNDALVRIIKQYTKMPDCNNPKWAMQSKDAEPSDKFVPNPYDGKPEEEAKKLTVSDIIKVYPNPCNSILKIGIQKSDVKDIYFVDVTGKTLFSIGVSSREVVECDVNRLSTGVYFVKAFYKGKWFSEKVIVVK